MTERSALSPAYMTVKMTFMELAGFSHVALTVSDMVASKEFYSQTLGLTVLDASDSYCARYWWAGRGSQP